MQDLHSYLNPGDDIAYFTTSSSSQIYGRIVSSDSVNLTVQRYMAADNDNPHPPTFECRRIRELSLSDIRDIIPRINVNGILFVFSEEKITQSPISLSGMTAVHYIRFNSDGSPINNWRAFSGVISLPGIIFGSLHEMAVAFSKGLNRVSMGQNQRYTFNLKLNLEVFKYIRTSLSSSTYLERTGFITVKRIHHDLSKDSRRFLVDARVLSVQDPHAFIEFKQVFGISSIIGSRAEYPKSTDGRVLLQFYDEVNKMQSVEMTFIPQLEKLFVKCAYTSEIVLDNFSIE